MKHILRAVIFTLLYSTGIFAQLSVTAELRPRLELRHGFRQLPEHVSVSALQVSQRSRLEFLYNSGNLSIFLSPQDVRLWGAKGMFENSSGLGLQQAFFEYKVFPGLSFKAGRQELRYNNQRLFGVNNWNQNGRTHDAAVLKVKLNDWNVHVGAAFNQDTDRNFGTGYSLNQYKTLNYIWINRKTSLVEFSGLAVADGFQHARHPEVLYLRATYGGSAIIKLGDKSSLEVYAYHQSGRTKTGQPLNAWYSHFCGNFFPVKKLKLTGGLEILSGNDNTKPQKQSNVFVPLYGSNHAFNGHLDYFTDMPAHTRDAGLINPYLMGVFEMNQRITMNADFHGFLLHRKALVKGEDNNTMIIEGYLGTEADLYAQYRVDKSLSISLGYSTLFSTKNLANMRGGSHREPVHWAWLMVTVRPVLLP